MTVQVRGSTRTLGPVERLALDRQLLSEGHDRALSRTDRSPELRPMDGSWWLVNDHGADLSVYVASEGRRFAVGERCAFAFPAGKTIIILRGYEVYVQVSGSVVRAERGPSGSPDMTDPDTSGADERVRTLFRKRHRHKVVLSAYYREYFRPGVEAPCPLGRDTTRLCMGLRSNTALEKALNDVSMAIWGRTHDTRHRLPAFLIRRSLLRRADQALVPHVGCNHPERPGATG